ncbi:hypothetical protein G9F71_025675 [Clostridium sp. FP2]|uniref:hypothetical protein n=1 Tax=Clostridium sp. FP2 TaxID=2724481 RepID=UPI0013E93C0D|nr:hypothetical protein [Clostridium sp. FP2]MBZ9626198.1 hypothetical protein [Clostridium sp. FP2]
MKDLVSFELKKILKRKSILVLLIVAIIATIFNFVIFHFGYTSMYIFLPKQNIAGPINGFSAIKYSKEINKKFTGELTDESVSKMKITIENEKNRLNMLSEDQRYLVLNAYRNQKAIINKLENDGTIGLVKNKFDFATKPLLVGYSTGWEKFINSFSSIGTLSLCFIIIVIFGNVFNQDYETKVD